jgi:hypothetical protein
MQKNLKVMNYGKSLTKASFSLFILTLFFSGYPPANAQYFGQNKIKNAALHFDVVQTPHLEIYHYLKNERVWRQLANDSERWYLMHQEVLKDTFSTLNPIIFYNNHADFQQTNTIFGTIGIGTGGVTEGLKNRVVLPINESNLQTDHVLGHEMVHAFQYHMLKTGDSTSLASIRNLPLWIVEGMAEYMSIGYVDSHTAMWMRDSYLNNDLPSLDDMSRNPKYFPYRYGQAFWAYVTGIWGDQIIAPLFKATAMYGYDQALIRVLGFDSKTLSNMWRNSLRDYYDTYRDLADTIAIGQDILSSRNSGSMNLSPAVSPNGKYVAYLSEKDLFSVDLFLADASTGNVLRKLYSTSKTGHIDDLNFLESAGTWSPGSDKIAITAYARGRNRLLVVDAARPGRTWTYDIPGVFAFTQPAWSPDGKEIFVTGLVEGQSDIYAFDLDKGTVRQITNDSYSYLQVHFSPDGRHIIYSTDRNPDSGQKTKLAYNIEMMELETGERISLPVFRGADNLNPLFSVNGSSVFFLSNRDGFRNLYEYEIESGKLYQLSNFFTGISGITALSPALSIPRSENKLFYSLFSKGKYSIYTAQYHEFIKKEIDPADVTFEAAILPPSLRMGRDQVVPNLKNPGKYPDLTNDQIKLVPYQKKFQLDYISQQMGAGVSTSRFGTGLAGGVNMIFSDMLGDNQLFGGVAVNGEIYDFGGQLAFLNSKRKLNWGASISHLPYPAYRSFWTVDSLKIGQDTVQVLNLAQENWRTFHDQVSLFTYFPISKSLRFEAGGSFSRYSFRRDRFNNFFYNGARVAQTREKLPSPDGFNLQQVDIAYVGDNAQFGIASPMQGFRHRMQVDRYFGELDFYSFLVDVRKYFWVNPFNVSFRGLHQSRVGKDAANGILPPFAIFFPTLVRGYDWQSLYFLELENDGFNSDDLLGSRMLVGNFEIRLPFTGPERLAVMKSRMFFSELAFFVDGGLAWGAWNNEQLETSDYTQNVKFRDRKPIFSTGLALRMNMFGAFILEPFYAIPIQSGQAMGGRFGVNFMPGW